MSRSASVCHGARMPLASAPCLRLRPPGSFASGPSANALPGRAHGPASKRRRRNQTNERTNKLACKSHGFWILLSSVQKDRNNLYWYLSTSSQDPTPVFKKKKKKRKEKGAPQEHPVSQGCRGLDWFGLKVALISVIAAA